MSITHLTFGKVCMLVLSYMALLTDCCTGIHTSKHGIACAAWLFLTLLRRPSKRSRLRNKVCHGLSGDVSRADRILDAERAKFIVEKVSSMA